jgi:O-antigen/teichoic acid export membrane protein
MIVIPIIIGLIVLVNPFIRIVLTDYFLPAASVLVVLAISIFITCFNSSYRALISGMDKPSILAKTMIVVCLLNVALNFLFIPDNGLLSPYGINGPTGAAVASLLSTLLGFFIIRMAAKKLIGIKIVRSYTFRQIFAGLVVGAILYLIISFTPYFEFIYWYHFLVLIGVGGATYFGMLFLMKEFGKEDLYFFLDLLRPKKMLKYISSELKEKPKKP